MNAFTARLSTYLTRAGVTVGICVALLALTPRDAAAITLCNAQGGCFTLSGVDTCEWVNANLPDVICFLSIATQGPTTSLVRDGRGGAVHTFTGRTGRVTSYVLSDANAARLARLMERSRSSGKKKNRDGDLTLSAQIQKEFAAIAASPDRKVSDQRLADISREYKLKIGEAR